MSNLMWRIIFVFFISAGIVLATPAITSVTAQQRYPWNGKVDITYMVTGDIETMALAQGKIASLKVTAADSLLNTNYTAVSLSGDMSLTDGAHSLVWDMEEDGLIVASTAVVFSVSCETKPAPYCVIDLSTGASASSYPVCYLSAPPSGGFNVDNYKKNDACYAVGRCGVFCNAGLYNRDTD